MFPIEIRSTLLGNIAFGVAICHMIIIQVYDSAFKRFGSSSPFLVAALIDVVMILFVLYWSKIGLIGPNIEPNDTNFKGSN